MTLYDPQKHHRRSMRLKGYDYSLPGAYFITAVAFQREELFGRVVNGVMQLSTLGQIVRDEWMRSIGMRREICLNEDEFIVMPNHIHGIVRIVDPGEVNGEVGADGVRPVDVASANQEGAYHAPQPDAPQPDAPQPGTSQLRGYRVGADGVRPEIGKAEHPVIGNEVRPVNQGANLAPLRRLPRSLSSFVAGFKAAVTGRARRELNMNAIWQRNYYDHIIRNEQEFLDIWNYIDTNPQKWQIDQLFSSAPANRFNRE